MGQRTTLFDTHVAAGAKVVDFGGYDMPLHYGSQIEEHHRVRRDVGMFDVSHMTPVDVTGPGATAYLQRLIANDVGKLANPGRALYGVMLREDAGIVDDLIVYRLADVATGPTYRVVVNCGTRAKDLAWMADVARGFDVEVRHRDDLAILAVQGPRAMAACTGNVPATEAELSALKPFTAFERDGWLIAHTGYTGEEGLELILPNTEVVALWQRLAAAGVAPAGLGARDTLRLEAGMGLYGQDMDETTHPLEANVGWTIAWKPAERDFIGRAALAAIRAAGSKHRLTGIVLETKGVMRHEYRVLPPEGASASEANADPSEANAETDSGETLTGDGVITSGIFSPTLGYSIGLARVPSGWPDGPCRVDVRGKALPARLIKPPFVRHGKQVFG